MSPRSAVFRRANLPVGILARLRSPQLARLLDQTLAAELRVTTEGRRIAEALHPMIGALTPGSPARRRVIGLRRALHAARQPTATEWNEEVAARLPGALTTRIARWTAEATALDGAEDRVEALLHDEHADQRRAVRESAAEPRFRLALDSASPVLAAELTKWIDNPARQPRERTVQSLVRYLARAAAKTSPLSTFLTSGPVSWTVDGPAVLVHSEPGHATFELSYRMLREHIARLVARRPGIRDHVSLRLNPSAQDDGQHLLYLDSSGNEAVCAVPARPAVREVATILAAEPGLHRAALRDRLTRGDDDLAPQVDAFLEYLTEVGLVVTGLPVNRIENVVGGAAAWLRDLAAAPDRPTVVEPGAGTGAEPTDGTGDEILSTVLAELDTTLSTRLPVDDAVGYRAQRARLLTVVHRLADVIEPDDPGRAVLTAVSAREVRDSVVTSRPLATCGTRAWRPVAANLDTLRGWLAPFSPSLPVRLMLTDLLGDLVRARGTLPVLAFYREYQQILGARDAVAAELTARLDPTVVRSARDSASPSVRRLAEVTRLAVTALSPHPLAHPADRVAAPATAARPQAPVVYDEVSVDIADLRAVTDRYPPWIPPLRSLSAGLQIARADGPSPQVVVNALHSGFGAFRARLDRLATGRSTAEVPDLPGDVLYAGFRDRFGMPLNDHGCPLPYEVGDTPSIVADDDAARLPLADLHVCLDDRSGLLALHSATHRRQVRVVHTGLLAEAHLPPLSRLLTVLSGETPPAAPMPRTAGGGITERRYRWPRLTAGCLVVCRSGTSVPVRHVPLPSPGERDGGYLLRLARWRAAEGLPRRCFFTLSRTGATALPAADAGDAHPPWTRSKWKKPMYLDFDSALLVRGFAAAVGRPDTAAVIFEEALPDPIPVGANLRRHVWELVLDVTADA